MVRVAVVTLALMLAQAAPPRPVAAPTFVAGRVLDAGTGRGVPRAIVRAGGAGQSLTWIAEDDGRFAFAGLPPGTLSLTAQKDGYLDGAFGQTRPDEDGVALPLAPGQWKTDVEIRLHRPAAVSGFVTDEAREPLVGIPVRAFRRQLGAGRASWLPSAFTVTNDQGEYRLHGLVPGDYVIGLPSIQVSAATATFEEIGRTGSGGGDSAALMFMSVWPQGSASRVIEGMLIEPDERNMRLLGSGATPSESSDGRPLAYPTVYYPAADGLESAVPVTLESGDDYAGVNFTLMPVPASRLSGRVEGPDGPVAGLMLRLLRERASDFGVGAEAGATVSAPDGSFTFLRIPAGLYVIHARSALSALRAWPVLWGVGRTEPPRITLGGLGELWGVHTVVVGGEDVDDVVVAVSRGVRLTGRVVFDGPDAEPALRGQVSLALEAESGERSDVPAPEIEEDGAFTIAGVRPGRYFLIVEKAPAGWFPRSATRFGQDHLRMPLDLSTADVVEGLTVTLTNRPTALAGSVFDGRGLAVPGARVIAIPARGGVGGAAGSRVRSVRADTYGVYRFTGLLPGDYDVVALEDGADARALAASTLAKLAALTLRVTLVEGVEVRRALRAR